MHYNIQHHTNTWQENMPGRMDGGHSHPTLEAGDTASCSDQPDGREWDEFNRAAKNCGLQLEWLDEDEDDGEVINRYELVPREDEFAGIKYDDEY